MALVGFHFKKMSIEKNKNAVGSVNVRNNMTIKKVKEAKLSLGQNEQKGLEFQFEFVVEYNPDIATITLNGGVLYVAGKDQIEEILEKWNKKKEISQDIMKEVSLHVVSKCNVQAIVLSKEMQLPPHITMVRIKDDDKKESKKKSKKKKK